MNEGLVWRKSCHSGDEGNCVEVADLSAGRAVRDSKNPASGHLTFSRDQWAAFTAGVRNGQFD
ncbi:MAG TPA: DUF397 domain-containing protein [Pseudonocardiaceae bacterium]|jgi:hypothetical protein